MAKKCVTCDNPFDTPGIRCANCRNAADPTWRKPRRHPSVEMSSALLAMLMMGTARMRPPENAPLKERVDFIADEAIVHLMTGKKRRESE